MVERAGWPARYEIRVDGVLNRQWSTWLSELAISDDGRQTVLAGTLVDQAALRGVLERLGDLGVTIVAVRRLAADS